MTGVKVSHLAQDHSKKKFSVKILLTIKAKFKPLVLFWILYYILYWLLLAPEASFLPLDNVTPSVTRSRKNNNNTESGDNAL